VTARAPGLPAGYRPGPRTAALLITAGDHPGRLRSEAARAHLRRRPDPRTIGESHPAPPRR